MALGPRLDLRQSQSLVMTPQLQQAIKLLALSNLEVETFIGEALDANPLLDLGEASRDGVAETVELPEEARRTTLESSPVDQLVAEGRAGDDRPLDIDPAAIDRDFDWGGEFRVAGSGEDGPGIDERPGAALSLAEHLDAQIGGQAPDAMTGAIARHIVGLLDEAGYLPVPLRDVATELGVPLVQAEAGLALVQALDPTGVGARSLSECIALQAIEADRHDPAMARLIENLDLVARGEFARLKRMCGVDDEDFADMLAELRGYDPKPGLRYGGGGGEAVTPDILLVASGDGWEVRLNEATLPRLVVNRQY